MTAATDTVEIDPATPKIFLAIWGANRGPEHIDFLKNEYHQLSGSTVALD
mgnify:CR=1 FL=1